MIFWRSLSKKLKFTIVYCPTVYAVFSVVIILTSLTPGTNSQASSSPIYQEPLTSYHFLLLVESSVIQSPCSPSQPTGLLAPSPLSC